MDRLAKTMTRIRLCKPDDLDILVKMAKADDHVVLYPTHVVERDNQMLGYISIANVPTVLLWLDTTRAVIRDSHAVMNFYENSISDRGGQAVIVPCNDKSPFRPFIEQVGYHNLKVGMFLKQL